jgi:hypothetical protein
LIVASPSRERVASLLGDYMGRFREEFYTSLPAATEALD